MSEYAPGPVAEHQRFLQPFVGRFKASVSIWMGPGEPMVSSGEMVNSWTLGGLYLRQVYQGDPVEGPFPAFQGEGYWGYNTTLARYEGFWIDNASTTMQLETGEWEEQGESGGQQWTMRSEFSHPQQKTLIARRSVITLVDDDRHSMVTYMTVAGGEEVKSMALEYVRIPE